MANPVPQQQINFADMLAGLSRPWKSNIWNVPNAGIPIPFIPQVQPGTESSWSFLSPPEPTSQVVTMPMPAPPGVAAPSVTPTVPSTYGASVSAMTVPNITIPDVAIPAAPEMPGGMTVEQAKVMGAALAPNVNLQPLTQADIFGSADPRATIGLLPEHLKTLVDMRAGARTQKAAEDAAAVALAKQTQGLDVAQDIAKDIPKQKQASDLAQFGAKAAERLTAQKAKTDRDTKQAELSLGRLKLLSEINKKAGSYVDMLNNEKARIQLLASTPGGASQITEAQARMAGILDLLPDAEALPFYQNYLTSIGMLPPELQAKMGLPPDMIAKIMLKSQRSLGGTNEFNATGVTFTPKTGGK